MVLRVIFDIEFVCGVVYIDSTFNIIKMIVDGIFAESNFMIKIG